jgi:hypothetical protein
MKACSFFSANTVRVATIDVLSVGSEGVEVAGSRFVQTQHPYKEFASILLSLRSSGAQKAHVHRPELHLKLSQEVGGWMKSLIEFRKADGIGCNKRKSVEKRLHSRNGSYFGGASVADEPLEFVNATEVVFEDVHGQHRGVRRPRVRKLREDARACDSPFSVLGIGSSILSSRRRQILHVK